MTAIADKYVSDQLKNLDFKMRYHMIPISQIHWQTIYKDEPEAAGNFNNILLFGGIALFILLIASINYMNLSTAQSMVRAKEVGMRKVIGAAKNQIVSQFLGESFITVAISTLIGIAIVSSCIPYINYFTHTAIKDADLIQPEIILSLLTIVLLVGFGAGIYPSIIISGFKPIAVLRGKFLGTAKGKSLRKTLVVFQFALTVLMIAGTIIISNQIDFMKNHDLGFNKNQKLVIPAIGGANLNSKYIDVKSTLLSIKNVVAASVSSTVPGKTMDGYSIQLAGHENEVNQKWIHIFIDPDFISVYGLKVIAGRKFNFELKSDEGSLNKKETKFIINESALKSCGWHNAEDALGAYLITGYGGRKGKIIGVVKNFNYEGLQDKIEPAVMEWLPSKFRMLTLNISTNDMSNTIKLIKSKWEQFFPNSLMNSFFLDSEFNQQYIKIEQTSKLGGLFTIIGIIIACAGLFGLVSFIVEQKTKEIGIRKSLGATSTNILRMLTFEFIKWIIVGNLIGLPAVYFIMTKWLQNFAYRINISPYVFIIASLISIVFAFVTILYKALRASIENPIKSLRYE